MEYLGIVFKFLAQISTRRRIRYATSRKMRYTAGLFMIVLLNILPLSMNAQPTDTLKRDTAQYIIGLVSTGSLNQAIDNTSYLFNNAARFSAIHRLFTFNLAGNYLYGKSNGVLTNNDVNVTANGDFRHHRNDRLFYWILANYTSSVSLKINSLI